MANRRMSRDPAQRCQATSTFMPRAAKQERSARGTTAKLQAHEFKGIEGPLHFSDRSPIFELR